MAGTIAPIRFPAFQPAKHYRPKPEFSMPLTNTLPAAMPAASAALVDSAPSALLSGITPVVAIHMAAALAAVVIGPVALWARRQGATRPRLHRAAGYAWVTLMVAAAVSALFITATTGPTWQGFGPIHVLVPVTLGSLVWSFRALARRDFATHRSVMQKLYIGACVVAGAFTLLPNRLLGQALWHSLGLR
jgi:uncharacterized membrane protein